MADPKIIVFGSLQGKLQSAFSKLATLHAKNNFSFALIVGDLFGQDPDTETVDALLNGHITVPLPTYFTIGATSLPPKIVERLGADEDICENLHFLGKRSITKTSSGIRLAALGGLSQASPTHGEADATAEADDGFLPVHSAKDAMSLKGAHSADILLTTAWPRGVWKQSKVQLEARSETINSSDAIAEICSALKPQYHFSASPAEFFYEREAFIHQGASDADMTFTRFISMAPFGNEAKAKALYAFTLPSATTTPRDIPQNSTPSPFSVAKRKHDTDEGYSRFAQTGRGRDNDRQGNKRRRQQRSPPPGPDRCFFCLSNVNIATHMVCSIAEESYLTTAKGPLTTPTTHKELGLTFPAHFIITPLAHQPTFVSMGLPDGGGGGGGGELDPNNEAVKTYAEMTRFRETLQSMVASVSKYRLGAVTWEINRQSNIHLHWQFLPVPARLVHDKLVAAAFRVEAENLGYPAFAARELGLAEQATEQAAGAGDFFRVWIWADDGDSRITGQSLVMPLADPRLRFDLQFGRRVVAKLLGLDNRVAWRDCEQTQAEEEADVRAFREAYKAWDFTM